MLVISFEFCSCFYGYWVLTFFLCFLIFAKIKSGLAFVFTCSCLLGMAHAVLKFHSLQEAGAHGCSRSSGAGRRFLGESQGCVGGRKGGWRQVDQGLQDHEVGELKDKNDDLYGLLPMGCVYGFFSVQYVGVGGASCLVSQHICIDQT